MDFETAARRVLTGRSILFTGAGFSFGASSISNKPLTDAAGLARELSGQLGEDNLPLDIATDEFLERNDPSKLVSAVQSLFTVREYQPHHRHISRLPWRRIYTTNYDNLLETCLRADGKTPTALTLSDDPTSTLEPGSIVHLNGFAERLSATSWHADLILTTTDYLSDKVRQSVWAEVLRSDFSMADSVIFMGYSLYDLDIARILYENPDVIKKTFFIVGNKVDRPTAIKTGRLGTSIARDVSDIADLFPDPASADAAVAAPFPVNLVPAEFEPATKAPTTDEVIAFLTKGDLDEKLLAKSVIDGRSEYYVSREEIEAVAAEIISGTKRVLIHSDLGNGKSLASLELGILLSVAGFRFFNFSGSTEGLENDFEYLESMSPEQRNKIVVLIEDILSFGQVASMISLNFPEIVIIATARTSAIETRPQAVSTALGDDHITFELNELSPDEAAEMDRLLLTHGLWGERQGWNDGRRLNYIEQKCGSHLSSLLLSVCKSSLVLNRLSALLSDIADFKDPAYESLIVVLATAYVGKTVNISQVCEIVQADLFKTGRAHRNELIGEFIHFSNNRIAVRSPVFAQVVLSELIPDHVLIEQIPNLVFRLHQLSGFNDFYRSPARRLMRFGAIERVLSNPDKEQKLVRYYENLRATGVVNQNPQFWLQYAIARMSFKDYSGAERNFEAAFGLVAGRAYDPYQIENQYARFLLESRSETTIWNDYFSAFEKAHGVIKKQMSDLDEGDYPYNVASNYLPFIESRHEALDQVELDRVNDCCDELLAIASGASASIKKRGYWKNFIVTMKAVKDFIKEVR